MTERCQEYAVVSFRATGDAVLGCDREPGHLSLHRDGRTGIRWSWSDPETDEIGPIEKCRECGREEWGHSWLDHMK